MIKITYSSTKNVAGIDYEKSYLVNHLYLDADLGRPSYVYEEEGEENTKGEFRRSFAKVKKQYRITTYLMEHIIDALSVLQLHDNITVQASNGLSFSVDEFIMSDPEWDEGVKCLAEVTISFTVFQESISDNC